MSPGKQSHPIIETTGLEQGFSKRSLGLMFSTWKLAPDLLNQKLGRRRQAACVSTNPPGDSDEH